MSSISEKAKYSQGLKSEGSKTERHSKSEPFYVLILNGSDFECTEPYKFIATVATVPNSDGTEW